MKKNVVRLSVWPLFVMALIALIAIIVFVLASRLQAGSEGRDVQPLKERLIKSGVPVKSLSVTRQSPLEIEVILQSSGNDDPSSRDDLWNKFLTEREIELAYLNFPIHIESYRYILKATA